MHPAGVQLPRERSIAELGQEVHAAADRADLRTVIARFLELLQRGEEGYPEAAALLVELAQDEQSPLSLWDDSARAAHVYPAILAHPEECLRFLLYLGQRDEDTLERPLRRMVRALQPGNRVVAMLLVNYDGRDPGLWHDYLAHYQAELAPDAEDYEFDVVVRAIESIPVDEASTVLVDLLGDETAPQRQRTLIEALTRRGDRRSRQALQQLPVDLEPSVRETAELAVRALAP
jgi:hypothetical protein